MTPGLIDSHYHLRYFGQQFGPGYLDIRHHDVGSKADRLRVVGDRALQLNESVIARDENEQPPGMLSHFPAENFVARHAPGSGDRTSEKKIEDIERGQELCLKAAYTSR